MSGTEARKALVTKYTARPDCARCGNPQGKHPANGAIYAHQEWVNGRLERTGELVCEGFIYPEMAPQDPHAGHNKRSVRDLFVSCPTCFRYKWEWMRDSPTMARYTYETLAPKLGLPIEPAQPRRRKRPSTRVDNAVIDAREDPERKPLYGPTP